MNPELASQWHPELNGDDRPEHFTAGSNRKVWWLCSAGHQWEAQINSRSRGIGCASCADRGYSVDRPGYLYLLKHPEWSMLQIGKTNFPDQRTAKHATTGWEVVDVRGPMEGQTASDLERSALAALDARGADLGSGHKFDGYTEAWSIDSLELDRLLTVIEWIRDDCERSLRTDIHDH